MSSILTYHNVGRNSNKYLSQLPSVEIESFCKQLKYLKKNYNILDTKEFLASKSPNNILLTFDDGLKCHHDIVAPILLDMNIPAIFFVSSGPILHKKSLLVHRLQLLIALSKNNNLIFDELHHFAKKHCVSFTHIQSNYNNIHIHKYESDVYNFIKKSIQIFIDLDLSMNFLGELISRYCADAAPQLDDIYMDFNDCNNMIQNGFDIGAHSKSHLWMEFIKPDIVKQEIISDCNFLDSLCIKPDFFCYPYGSYSSFLINALKKAKFKYAFSIEEGDFNFFENNPYRIKRYDVNEFFKFKKLI